MLSFELYIHIVVNKASQTIGLLIKTVTYINKDMFIELYKALVRSHLEYGNVIWYLYLWRQSMAVQRIQRRPSRLLNEFKNLSYAERLKYLKLHSLKGSRLRGDLIETYQICLNNLEAIEFQILPSSYVLQNKNSSRKDYC